MSRALREPSRRPPRMIYVPPAPPPHVDEPLLPQAAASPKDAMVSVVMTSYNRPKFVKEAIQSVLDQTYEDFELLVMDDGSNEDTLEAIDSFDDYRIVKVFLGRRELEGARYCHSINEGIEFASGSFITYLTDDDLYLPRRLEVMTKALLDDPKKWVVYGKQFVRFYDAEMKMTEEKVRSTIGVTRDMLRITGNLDHNSFMHRAECFNTLRKPYWPTHAWWAGDVRFWETLVPQWNFYPIEEVLDVHRFHENGIMNRMEKGKSPIYTQEI